MKYLNEFPHIKGIQLYKDQTLIMEEYREHSYKTGLHQTGCIFKSFVSAAIGSALKNDHIQSTDQKICDFFPELTVSDSRMRDITNRHALTKTTGIAWPPPGNNSAASTIQAVLHLNMDSTPGKTFAYKPDPQLLVCLLPEVSGITFDDYMDKYIFKPLDINHFIWDTSMARIQNLKMTMEDFAKLAMLYLNGGTWNGTRILEQTYVNESIQPVSFNVFPEQMDYGYLWWSGHIGITPVFFSSGFGGQYLIAIPEHNAVVVIVSDMDKPHPENKFLAKDILTNLIKR